MKYKRNRCPAILAAVLILVQSAAFSSTAEQLYLPGDADSDGVVSLADATQICRRCADWDVKIDEYNADVNLDNIINLKDAVLILRNLAGGWNVELGEAELTFVVASGNGTFTDGSGFTAADTTKKIVPGKSISAQDASGKGWPADPKKSGCSFNGWFTEPTGGTKVLPSDIVAFKGNRTLYAQFGGYMELPEIVF